MRIIKMNNILKAAVILIAALVLSGCGQDAIHTKLNLRFHNLIGPGMGGSVSIECVNGKLKSYRGTLITPLGLEAGCARSMKLKLPQGEQSCPNTPLSVAAVSVDGILNNKPIRGNYSFGRCSQGIKAWDAVSQLWLEEGPKLIAQKVFIVPVGKVGDIAKPYDQEFKFRNLSGEASSCLLLLAYNPLKSQGCNLLVPKGSPVYIAYYMNQRQLKSLLGARPDQILQVLAGSKSGKPPLGFPGS